MNKDDEFSAKLLATFLVEAQDHLNLISSGLLGIEKSTKDEKKYALIETIYREIHTLKGAARVVNLVDIESICQSIENIFFKCKSKTILLSAELFDTLHSSLDVIQEILKSVQMDETSVDILQISSIHKKLAVFQEDGMTESSVQARPEARYEFPGLTSNISMATIKLDKILLQAEEMLTMKLTLEQRALDLSEVENILSVWSKEWGHYADHDSLSGWLGNNSVETISDNYKLPSNKMNASFEAKTEMFNLLKEKLTILSRKLNLDRYSFGLMVDTLLEDTKKSLLRPFSSLLDLFPKMVRDLSRDQKKEVNLEIRGDIIEVDKRILDELKDVLVHLVRNSITHGIEKPAERLKLKKPEQGSLKIIINQMKGNEVEIVISDDGRGIDLASVKKSAIKYGLITNEKAQELTDPEVINLVYHSGISTSAYISELAGRGLGMSIVQEKISKIGGKIFITSLPHQGVTIKCILPLTMATYKGVIIRVGEQFFVLPTANLERVIRIKPQEIKTIESKETISLNNQTLALVRLETILELPFSNSKKSETTFYPVLILNVMEKRIAFQVDAILNEQDIIIKNFTKPLLRVRNISGATILGSGKAIPILNVPDLIKSAIKIPAITSSRELSLATLEQKKLILVVEDSISTRMLLKNILELAGFEVMTAADGANAWTILKSREVSLVVSDVEMPILDGFELTKKIRKDSKLADLPIVLVTSHQSPEDCEKGIDVGADAYLTKSTFDNTNLIDIIHRLI